jgi:hypothetical protein
VVFDFFEVGVARKRLLPSNAELLFRAQQLVQRRPALRQLTGNFADGTNFAGGSVGAWREMK